MAIAVKLLTDLLHSPRPPSCDALLPVVKVRGLVGEAGSLQLFFNSLKSFSVVTLLIL